MKDELSEYLNRPKRYDNIDGTGEIFMGLMIMAFTLSRYLQPQLGEHSFLARHDVLLMFGILFPTLGFGFLLQKFVKRRITFPRTGYVAMGSAENPGSTKIRGLAYAALLSAIFALLIAVICVPLLMHRGEHTFNTQVARLLYAALFLGGYAFWTTRMAQGQRWKWILFCMQLAAVLVLVSTVPDGGGLHDSFYRQVMLMAGTAWIVSGAITFLTYIRHYPANPMQ